MRLKPLALLLLLLMGCSPRPELPIQTLASTNQVAAPALWVESATVISAWIAQDSAGIRQEAQILRNGTWSDPVTLPLPPVQPYNQQLIPASEGASHLFWLDQDSQGILHLYTALLGPRLGIERGPLAVSESLALRYVALAQTNGGALLLWSGGLIAEPSLFARQINARGLAGSDAIPLAYGADWPAAIQGNDGTLHIFWLDSAGQTVQYGQFDGVEIIQIEAVDDMLQLASGDRLHSLAAALDQTHIYLLWNLTRRSGQIESGMIARPLAGGDWTQISRLGLSDSDGDAPQTSFNTGGAVQAAADGERWLTWVAPLPGQFDTLPVAAQIDGDLALVYLQAGAIIGYQPLTPAGGLLRPPTLRTDRDRYLYLTWADSQANGPAALNLLTTRP